MHWKPMKKNSVDEKKYTRIEQRAGFEFTETNFVLRFIITKWKKRGFRNAFACSK